MQCIQCGQKNTGGVVYCARCGVKLDMTADEIQLYYAQKVRDENREKAEFYARRLLTFAVVLLVMAVTLMILAGGAPKNTSFIPSGVIRTDFAEMQGELDLEIRGLFMPEEENR